jgi:Flp pilus assembly protein TadG
MPPNRVKAMRPANKGKRGFVLLTTSLSGIALFGMMGLAVDIGRMYIVKNEAQTFTDLVAVAATRQLDGTAEGVARARQEVANSRMKWNFATTSFSGNTVTFSSDNQTWTDGSTNVKQLKYVLVTTDVGVDLFFIPIATSSGSSISAPPALLITSFHTTISVRSAAAQQLLQTFPPSRNGVLPFAPLAHDPADPNFGFKSGDIITLRWPSNVNGNKKFCDADDNPQWVEQSILGGGDDRGYIQETSSDAIRQAVESDKIFYTVTLGQPVNMTGGIKATQANSLMVRANQDLDTTSTTYAEYVRHPHNQRRIGVVPIVNANDNFRVIGFAKVFLPMSQDQQGNKSLCAEYVGNYYLMDGVDEGGTGTDIGVFTVRLLQ